MWAFGCVLEELAYGRVSFHQVESHRVADAMFARLGTPMPPHALAQLCPYKSSVEQNEKHRHSDTLHAFYDKVPAIVTILSKPKTLRSLVCGLLQLAPDERMTSQTAIARFFFDSKLLPIVSDAFAGRGRVFTGAGRSGTHAIAAVAVRSLREGHCRGEGIWRFEEEARAEQE